MKKEELIVIDIETAASFPDYDSMDFQWQELWVEKNKRQINEQTGASEFYQQRAGVMAEFGKIICICIGYFSGNGDTPMTTNLFFGDNEKLLLHDLIKSIYQLRKKKIVFAGHNIREFDLPFICRRLLINNIPIPEFLDLQNTKPWDNTIIDTFQYWRFGDYKNYTSLKLLAKVLDIPSSKDDIDGSMVGPLYWETDSIQKEINLIRIASYCQKDVEVTAKILFRLTGFT
jgi:DNA polymerase elongation subunit (family B)